MADADPDAMVIVAALVSRVEALVVASMLEAAGVDACIGALGHAGVEVNSVTLGGYRLWVPASQHLLASNILLEVLGKAEWRFCYGLQKAVLRVLALWVTLFTLVGIVGVSVGGYPLTMLVMAPLSGFILQVNPQGSGDYYLAAGARHPAA